MLLLLALFYGSLASADAIDMRDYILVQNEITEAEVLYKFGYPDHETINSDYFHHVSSKIWFYLPKLNGRLISKDRYRAR